MKPAILVALIILFIVGFTVWFVTVDELPKFEVTLARLKGAVRSKTIWLNGMALLFVHSLPDLIDYASQNLPLLQPYLPADRYTSVVGAIAIANLILRYKTKTPLELK